MRPRNPGPPSLLDALAEQRIAEAAARGEFEDLPGAGEPLALEDNSLIPEELRAAYRLLKNAGYVPAEIEHSREIRDIETLLQEAQTEEMRGSLLARLNWLLTRSGNRPRNLQLEQDYFEKIAARLEQSRS